MCFSPRYDTMRELVHIRLVLVIWERILTAKTSDQSTFDVFLSLTGESGGI